MNNSLQTIAENYFFPKEAFLSFVVKNGDKYHIEVIDPFNLGEIFVNNWFVDELIADFKKTCQEFSFEVQSPNNPCFSFRTYGTSLEEANKVAKETCKKAFENGYGWKLVI